ncbi:MAG: segregation/condensation protein A [archaeon]
MDSLDENPATGIDKIMNDDEIVDLIQNGDWQEVILAMTHDMNPWNIDLVKLNIRFTAHIKQMHEHDLRIPSKILLAAAIIYRLKSETLRYIEEAVSEDLGLLDDDLEYTQLPLSDESRESIVIPPIQIPLRREPKREVSIDELVDALGKAMVIKNRRDTRNIFQIDLQGEDISKCIEDLFHKINKYLQTNNIVNFDQLLGMRPSREEKIRNFSSLLHLSNQGRILCEQPEMFGEIKIRLVQ